MSESSDIASSPDGPMILKKAQVLRLLVVRSSGLAQGSSLKMRAYERWITATC